MDRPVRIGVSSCLLGEPVRYDGGHKRDSFLTDVLARYVEFVLVCPEVEIGLGTPRETIRLERRNGLIQLVATESRTDHTRKMRSWARRKAAALAREGLSGYILKARSPSCGPDGVAVFGANGAPNHNGRGLFAEVLIERFGNLPVEEEGRLQDPALRENFIERVFAYQRLGELFRARWRMRDAIAFHAAHKLLLMAHSPKHYRSLGRLVAQVRDLPRAQFRERYESEFMAAMRVQATPGRHASTLQHAAGYLKEHLDAESQQEVLGVIEDYRCGQLPLIAPITLLRHFARRHGIAYLEGQVYLEPHPKEFLLRNHA
jgi:uncharacterized protein YbgA (DUF1722 family)/uncharacterized protein YbbK (DUF523 family)